MSFYFNIYIVYFFVILIGVVKGVLAVLVRSLSIFIISFNTLCRLHNYPGCAAKHLLLLCHQLIQVVYADDGFPFMAMTSSKDPGIEYSVSVELLHYLQIWPLEFNSRLATTSISC